MKLNKIFFSFFIFLLFFNFVLAQVNETEKQEAILCIENSNSSLVEMQEDGINSSRLNDIYEVMRNYYEAQMVLSEKGHNTDFSYVLSNCREFEKVENLAYISKDLIYGIEEFYSGLKEDIRDTSQIEENFNEIYLEYENERYEEVEPLVDETYNLIIEVKSTETALNIFYESTTKSLKKFFLENYKLIIIIIFSFLILFLIFRKLISRFILKLKLNRLALRKDVLKNLIREAQKKYFDEGKISKSIYEIRLEKFSDLIRELESQELNIKENLLKNKASKKIYQRQIEDKRKKMKDKELKKKIKRKLKKKQKRFEKRNSKKISKRKIKRNERRTKRKHEKEERKRLKNKKLNDKKRKSKFVKKEKGKRGKNKKSKN